MDIKRGTLKLGKDISSRARRLTREIKNRIATAIMAALALVIALVWNEAIKLSVDKMLASIGLVGTAYIYKILAALIVTIICVIGIIYFSRWVEK